MTGKILLARARNDTLCFTKAVRIEESTTVGEAMRIIAEKCSIDPDDSTSSRVLYVPGKNGAAGTYLRNLDVKVLSCAKFTDRDEIELRQVAASLTVVNRCGDDDSRQKNVDLEHSGLELLKSVCEHYGYSNVRDYEIHVMPAGPSGQHTKRHHVSLSKALAEQGISESTIIHVRRKARSRQLKFSTSQRSKKGGLRRAGSSVSSSMMDVSEPMFVKHTRDDYCLNEEESNDGNEVFGYPIMRALTCNKEPNYAVAPLISAAIKYIELNAMDLEGIFRLSGKAWQVDKLRSQLNNTNLAPDFSGVTDAHLVCAVLKQYLRELPEPVIPFHNYEEFLDVSRDADSKPENMLEGATACIGKLDKPNWLLLRRLLLFLLRVSEHSQKNKMGVRNLATIFGPNILRQEDQSDMMAMVRDSGYITSLTMCLIENATTLFPKPSVPPRDGQKRKPMAKKAVGVKPSMVVAPSKVQSELIAVALYAFVAQCDDQLSLAPGKRVKILRVLESGWCFGEIQGKQGFFPKHFCSDPRVPVPGAEPPMVRLVLSPRAPVSNLPSPIPSPITRRSQAKNRSLRSVLERRQKHQSMNFETMEDAQRKITLQFVEIERLREDLAMAKMELMRERQERKMFETQALVQIDSFTRSILAVAQAAAENGEKQAAAEDSSAQASALS